ncbi:YraN family protein [Arsenicitalea aurantiaca]|uniref:UPF0102 protein EMQ25_12770 n=1 Tax=Arsenicitalea aurantiaca TaxID=1783274 RepID=A0A433X7Z1_9HYPH|nr:YraN family protein [Arsenicitalea aurantiaca]RUT30184.1 YraN family protein [Arsenicitalea aurantiaca]
MPPSPSRPPAERTPAARRLRAEGFGRRGETLAALYLGAKFYRIIHRRYRTPVGEIDLIVRRGRVTVFVEVKSRMRSDDEAEALEAVDTARIGRAAQYFLARHPQLAETPLRFDVIFLAPFALPRHVTNAFDVQ